MRPGDLPTPPLPGSLVNAADAPAADAWEWYTRKVPWWGAFVLPIVLGPVPTILAYFFLSDGAYHKVWQTELITLGAIDVGVFYGIARDLKPWLVLAVVLWVEILWLVWLVRYLDFLRRLPRIDRFFQRRERRAAALYQRRHYLQRFHFWGLVVLTFLPLGSGIVAGVLVGKFMGLSDRRLISAVYLGTILWATFLVWVAALSVEPAKEWLESLEWWK